MKHRTDSEMLWAKALGTRIQEVRNSKGIKQLHISFNTRISQVRLSYIENGRVMPTILEVVKIANALNVPLMYLMPTSKI